MALQQMSTSLGRRLRAHRLRAGLTQRQLAERAAMSVRALRDIEQDRAVPRPSSLEQLATALNVSGPDRAELLAALRPGPAQVRPSRMWVGILGPLELRRDDRPVRIASSMQGTLLGLLAVQPGQHLAVDEIIDVLWGDAAPPSSRRLVHTYVGQVRTLLEPGRAHGADDHPLRLVHGGYRLDLDQGQSELCTFDRLTAQATRARVGGDLQAALEFLAGALECWRGPVLAGSGGRLRHHPAAVAAAGRRVAAALAFGDLALELGCYADAVARLRPVLHGEPLHEGLAARLMLALAGCGAQAAALALFHDVRTRLADELAIEPSPELRAAHLRVLRGQTSATGPQRHLPATGPQRHLPATARGHHPPDGGAAAPAPPPRETPAQLPPDVAAFTGRTEHLRQLDALLCESGDDAMPVISTITGTGGVGKTALAVHWASRLRDRFPDGQFYVNLRGFSVEPPRRPIEALAGFLRAFGIAAEQVPADLDEAAARYRSIMATRRMVILLDNAANAEQVRPLLPGGTGCVVLVTSRDRLSALVAEQGARPTRLDVFRPDEAVDLLAATLGRERVTARRPAAAELVRLCGYLPLAVRIAAANLLNRPCATVEDFVAELRAGDRLDALAVDAGGPTAVRRTFDLSYRTLDKPARRLFRLLGLVPGPDIDVPAAAALADLDPATARALVDRLASSHLLQESALGRYTMHDLLRLYASNRAASHDDPATRDAAITRLLDRYCDRVRAAAAQLYPQMPQLPAPFGDGVGTDAPFAEQQAARAWMDRELPNLVALVRHCADRGRYRGASWLGYALRGYFDLCRETVTWTTVADAALAAAERDGDRMALAAAEHHKAHLDYCVAGVDSAIRRLERAAALARSARWDVGLSAILAILGALCLQRGRRERAERHLRAARTLASRLNFPACEGNVLDNLGEVAWQRGQPARAVALYRAAISAYRRVPCLSGEGHALTGLGVAAHALGRLDQASQVLGRALSVYRRVGNRAGEAYTGYSLALLRCDRGEPERARDDAAAALRLAHDSGDRRSEAAALIALGTIELRLRRHHDALLRYERAVDLGREADNPYLEAEALIGLATTALANGDAERVRRHADAACAIASDGDFRLLVTRARAAAAAAETGTSAAGVGSG